MRRFSDFFHLHFLFRRFAVVPENIAAAKAFMRQNQAAP
jgi:hypothetical protein